MRISVSQLRRIIRESVERELHENENTGASLSAGLKADLKDRSSDISRSLNDALESMSTEELEKFIQAASNPSAKEMLARDAEEKVMGESHRYSRGRRLREGDATWKQASDRVFKKDMDDFAPLSLLLGGGATVGLSTIFADWLLTAPQASGLSNGLLPHLPVVTAAGLFIGTAVSYAISLLRAKKALEANKGKRS